MVVDDEGPEDAVPRPGRAGPVPDVPGFELGELLARGATSEVWAGVAVDGGRRVAVKVVSAALAPLEAAAREAAVSSSAASWHVVGVEACVPLPDGRVALVMPHLRGGSLGGLVRARGHLVPGEVVTVLAPVASALGRLHDVGVVHGDVSPGNVLLDLDGRPLLGDLGLGHVVGDVSPGVWGTEGYVAPEVLMGAEPTPASDVYGVGALGWLCVSGQVPGAPGLRPALADVSRTGSEGAALLGVLDAAVAPDPGDRPSAHELAWQLFSAADPEPLELVRGDDDVSVVTYRLRAAAERGRAVGAVPRRRARHARVATRLARTPARRGRSALAGAAASLVLLAALVLAVAASGRGGDVAQAVATGGPTPVEPSAGASAGPGVPARGRAADPREDPRAPHDRAAELLTVLADARASAWREATPALLHAAVAPGSAVASRDAVAVTDLVRAGVRYSGLRYTVDEVSLVSSSARTARVRARIGTGPYTVVGPTGSTRRPAAPGQVVVVDVVKADAGWRISDVRTGP